jgi:hypothetical protein
MNRRNFFARTVFAAVSGFAAVLVPKLPRRWRVTHPSGFSYVLDESRCKPNPAWVDAGPERNVYFACNRAAFRCYNHLPPPYRPEDLEAGTYPHSAGETIR